MKTLSARPLVRTLGALLLGIAVAGAPGMSYAQHGGFGGGGHGGGGGGHGGGGGGGGGGGHFGGGGGHFGGGGGGHFGGGGGGRFGGGGGHFGGGGGHFGGGHYGGYYGGGHFAGGSYGGSRYLSHGGAFAGGYAAGGAHYYAGARGYGGVHYGAGYATGRLGAAGYGAGRFAGGQVFYPGRGYYPGRFWGGGYWNGIFWPHCYFYPGFAWFLPFLPFGYATYWWDGVPYYYANDLYYTYSPADNGYVVTEPPPAAGGDVPDNAGAPGSAGDIYVYPRNGQSDQQTANDRYECHSWAVGQTGFDPTRGGQQSGNPDDYRRAMISCLDARGYSAR